MGAAGGRGPWGGEVEQGLLNEIILRRLRLYCPDGADVSVSLKDSAASNEVVPLLQGQQRGTAEEGSCLHVLLGSISNGI